MTQQNNQNLFYELCAISLVSVFGSTELLCGCIGYALYKHNSMFKNQDYVSIGVSIMLYYTLFYYVFKLVGVLTILFGGTIVVGFISKQQIVNIINKQINNKYVDKVKYICNSTQTKYNTICENKICKSVCSFWYGFINKTFEFITSIIYFLENKSKGSRIEFVFGNARLLVQKVQNAKQVFDASINMAMAFPMMMFPLMTPMQRQETMPVTNEQKSDDEIKMMLQMFQTMVKEEERNKKTKRVKKIKKQDVDNISEKDTECLDNLIGSFKSSTTKGDEVEKQHPDTKKDE